MKKMTMSITTVLALAALLLVTAPAGADVILGSDFPTSGDNSITRSNNGDCVVSDIPWTTNGVEDPGDLDFEGYTGEPDFNTSSAAGGYIVPDVNTDNEGNWNVSIPLDITVPGLDIESVVLSGGMFKGNGMHQNQNRDTNIKVSFVGSVSGEVAAQTLTPNSNNTWDVTYDFDGGVSDLMADEDWELVIETVDVDLNGPGNFTGIGELTVNGTEIPEPATMSLLAIGGLGALLRRRRR